MAETLFSLSLALAREIEKGGLHEGSTTTGGAGTDVTLTDPTIALLDGVLDGGTLWIRTGLRAGQTSIITTQVADVLVFSPALSGVLAIGDQFTAFGPEFPRQLLRRAVNIALRNLPPFATHDVSLTTLVNTEDYDLPTGVENIKSVEIGRVKPPNDNEQWMLHTGWIEIAEPAAIPTPSLRFWKNVPQVAGYTIRLGFNTIHRELTADSNQINSGISPTRLIYEALAEAWLKRIRPRDSQSLDEQAQAMYNRAIGMAKMMPGHRILTLPDPIFIAGVGSRGGGQINPDLIT